MDESAADQIRAALQNAGLGGHTPGEIVDMLWPDILNAYLRGVRSPYELAEIIRYPRGRGDGKGPVIPIGRNRLAKLIVDRLKTRPEQRTRREHQASQRSPASSNVASSALAQRKVNRTAPQATHASTTRSRAFRGVLEERY